MKPKTAGKLATGLMVLLLVLSGAMVLQWNARAEERHVGTVEGIVQAEDGSLIPEGFNIKLEDLNEEITIESQTHKGGYFQFSDLDVGHYQISVPSQTHDRAYHGTGSGVLEVTRDASVYEELTVVSRVREHTVNGTVLDELGEVVEDAQIHLFDGDYHFQTGIDNVTSGEFEFKAYNGTFDLRVEAEDHAPYMVHDLVINQTTTIDLVLKDTPHVSGHLWSTDGYGITSQIEVTLIDQHTSDMLRATMPEGNPWFTIGASTGEYTLIVSADGYKPYINENIEIVDEYSNVPLGRRFVDRSETEKITTDITFEDWNSLTVTRERTLEINSRMMGLDHWYLGNLRMQIDMVFGNGDGVVTESDVEEFRDWLEYREANHLTTQRMLWLEDSVYELEENYSFDSDDLDALVGEVTDLDVDTMTITSEKEYAAEDMEFPEDGSLLINMGLKNDVVVGNYRDYSYQLNIPEGFERVPTAQQEIPDDVTIEGHTQMSIDTPEGVGRSYLTLDVHMSEQGEASVILVEDVNVYEMDDKYYAVRQDTEVTIRAELTDPVGREEDANFTWLIDGTEIGKYGSEIVHTFTAEDEVNLTVSVKQAGGLIVTSYANVLIDGTGPQGDIEVDETVIDEREEIMFSAYNFTDESGVREFTWNFSDGTDYVTGTNVTHSFELYGVYEVTVNATDVVGNWNLETIEIEVRDVTPPVARFVATYDDEEVESDNITAPVRLERGQEFSLDASISYDPEGFDGEESDISVVWWFSRVDYRSEEFEILNYSFTELGTYDITLNVTDEAGNYDNITRTLEIVPGPSPNIEIVDVSLAEDRVRAGDTVQVVANVTNYGTANATSVSVLFRVDGEPVTITPGFYYVDNEEAPDNTIPMDEYRLIKFDWEADDSGEHTLTVNVTDAEEPAAWQYDNEMDLTVNVDPPQWRTMIGYILVPVIIIGVAVGLYLNKDKVQGMLKK